MSRGLRSSPSMRWNLAVHMHGPGPPPAGLVGAAGRPPAAIPSKKVDFLNCAAGPPELACRENL